MNRGSGINGAEKETKDYISYATLLDYYLSDPSQYTEDEKEKLLKTLLEIFLVEDELVYEIAWDVPSIILPYFESQADFYEHALSTVPSTVTLMKIFKVLAKNGNQKELFLKSIECLGLIEVEPLDEDDERNAEVAERFFELKFVAIFELLSATLSQVEAQYPSRFLANATAALIAFVVQQLDTISLRSLTFILRRLFLLGRDYNPSPGDKVISDSEIQLQQRLLQRFVTDVASMGLEKYSIKWAQRFYVELKKGVAFNQSLVVRSEAYDLDETTYAFDDIIYRITQLAYSVDIELHELFADLVKETTESADTERAADEQEPEAGPFDFTSAKTPQGIPLSKEGILLLATSARFHDRSNPRSFHLAFPELIDLTTRFLMDGGGDRASAGIQDALCFWALWVSRKTTRAEVRAVAKPRFFSYLQMLMYMAAMGTTAPDVRQMAYSITARLLGLHAPEVRLEYLVDTIENCPFPNVREASVRMLKDFVAPAPVPAGNADKAGDGDAEISAAVDKLSLSESHAGPAAARELIVLDDVQRRKIEALVLADAKDLLSTGNEEETSKQEEAGGGEDEDEDEEGGDGLLSDSFPVLLSWLNFLAVADVDPAVVQQVYALGQALVAHSQHDNSKAGAEQAEQDQAEADSEGEGDSDLSTRVTLLEMGLGVLKAKWKL